MIEADKDSCHIGFKESGIRTINKQVVANTMNSYFYLDGKDLTSKIESVPNPMVTEK